MTNYDQVCERWVDNAVHGRDLKDRRTERVYYQGDTIFSYGSHFPMARIIREAGEFSFVLVNGDTWSPSTTNHQNHMRSAIRGLAQVIIPFQALRAAGVNPDTIRLIQNTGDRHEVKQHESTVIPSGYAWKTVPVTEHTCKTPDMLQAELDEQNTKDYESYAHNLERHYQRITDFNRTGELKYAWERAYLTQPVPQPPTAITLDDLDERHGGSYLGARGWSTYGSYDKVVGQRQALIATRGYGREWNGEVDTLDDGSHVYRWETRRHWLGDSLITAEIVWTEQERCRHCKGTGWIGGNVPEPRGAGEEWDCWYERTKDISCEVKANVKAGLTACFRGRRNRTRTRRSFYLSGFDAQETRPSYFFCELPQGVEPTSVDEAIECLKPDPVILAEGMGREVLRQGDIFAIPMPSLTKRALTQMGARHERRGRLLNTNHVATDTAYLPDGTTLARGALVHAPEWRAPDHKRVPLASVWHVVVKNTVPIAA